MLGRPFLIGWEHLDEDEKKPLSGLTPNSRVHYLKGKAVYISESELYSLILRSKLPVEKSSKKWVTVMLGLKGQKERMSSRLPGHSIATDPQIVKTKIFGVWEWQGHSVDIQGTTNEPYFHGRDGCAVLGYTDLTKVPWERLDDDEKRPLSEVTPNSRVTYNQRKAVYISGSGL